MFTTTSEAATAVTAVFSSSCGTTTTSSNRAASPSPDPRSHHQPESDTTASQQQQQQQQASMNSNQAPPRNPSSTSSTSWTSSSSSIPRSSSRRAVPASLLPPRQITTGGTLVCAVCSGSLQAVVFNPWDKALYLSVLHRRPFLSRSNFDQPFQGFSQAVVHRVFSGGIFFMFEDLFWYPCHRVLFPHNAVMATSSVGLLAGALNGFLLNPVAITKYHMWGRNASSSVWIEMTSMWRSGGFKPFTVGAVSTVLRDATFGMAYTFSKWAISETWICATEAVPPPLPRSASSGSSSGSGNNSGGVSEGEDDGEPAESSEHVANFSTSQFATKALAGGIATLISAPINFVRNLKYAHHISPFFPNPPSTMSILSQLYNETLTHTRTQGLWNGLCFLQMRFNIGWGTGRVAVGMAFGDYVYQKCKRFLIANGLTTWR